MILNAYCSGCLSRQSLSINIIAMSEKCRLSLLKKDIYNTVYLSARLLWMKIVWNLPNLWNWLLRIWIYPCNACRMTSVQFDLPWTNIPFSLEYHHLPFFCWRGTFLRFYTTHHICFLKLLSHISTCLMTKCLVLMYLDGVYLRRQLFFYWISKKEALSFLPSPIVAAALVLSSYSETTAHYHLVTNWTIIFSQVGVEKLDSISHHGFGDLKKSKDLSMWNSDSPSPKMWAND